MRTISKYINESLNAVDGGVDKNIKNILESAINSIDLSKLETFKSDNPDKFDKSKENKKLFIDFINKDGNIKAISSEDYNNENNSIQWKDLSAKEKSKIDSKYGDIIFIDEDGNRLAFVDLKISEKFIGAISLGSLTQFNENGIYVCIDKSNGDYRIFSHKVIYNLVKNDTSLINLAINKYKGYEVEFEGEKYMSEDFIKGNDIKRLIK